MLRFVLAPVVLAVVLGFLPGCASFEDQNPEIYDPHADGEQLLAESLQVARVEQKRVLLNLGANWCSDSQAMFTLFNTNTEIRRLIQQSYVFTMLDVNQRGLKSRNSRLVERLGNPIASGIPVLLILDAQGNVLNTDSDERLADSDHEHPALVLAYLRKWAHANASAP